MVAVAFLFLALAMRREPLATGFPAAAAATFGFVYIAMPLAMLVQLRQQGSGAFLILYVLIVVWMGDTVAYYTGRALGRHKLAPRISPGKTWEGTVGSLVGAIVCGTLVFAYSRPDQQRIDFHRPADAALRRTCRRRCRRCGISPRSRR